ncbi:m-phase inducer phosphatase [Dispira simplex]|nr:m-phase inducer phosphatase [Dispira simplex]
MLGSGLSPLPSLSSQRSLVLPSPVSSLTSNLSNTLCLPSSPRKTPRRSLLDFLANAADEAGVECHIKRQRLTTQGAPTGFSPSYRHSFHEGCTNSPLPQSMLTAPQRISKPPSLSCDIPSCPSTDGSHARKSSSGMHTRKPPVGRVLARCRSSQLPDLMLAQYSLKRALTTSLPSPLESSKSTSTGSQPKLSQPALSLGLHGNDLGSPLYGQQPKHRTQSYSEPLEEAELASPVSPCHPVTHIKRTRSFSQAYLGIPLKGDGNPSEPMAGGDSAGCQILPCLSTSRDPLKRITMDTMVQVMHGVYRDQYDELLIVDCRFPYEYEGGHIQGAINLSTPEDVKSYFLDQPITNKRRLVIFHCEYSLHRAPNMAMTLRKQDRQVNAMAYPFLYYPEMYILQGGYRNFFYANKTLCYPQQYVEMNDVRFRDDCRSRMATFKRGFKRSKSYTEGFPAMLQGAHTQLDNGQTTDPSTGGSPTALGSGGSISYGMRRCESWH